MADIPKQPKDLFNKCLSCGILFLVLCILDLVIAFISLFIFNKWDLFFSFRLSGIAASKIPSRSSDHAANTRASVIRTCCHCSRLEQGHT